jgi:hypothetical protein
MECKNLEGWYVDRKISKLFLGIGLLLWIEITWDQIKWQTFIFMVLNLWILITDSPLVKTTEI